ncbi:MAG: Spy/CpxP family protein refolding chaperone [Myxococcales bacterium]|nr:Spy/CpxP family protein refolding chaperone [Myxococcales bacterium]
MMLRRRSLPFALLLALLALPTPPAAAQPARPPHPPPPPWGIWRDAVLARGLGLTSAQISQLRTLDTRERARMQALRKRFERARRGLDKAFTLYPADANAARVYAAQLAQLENQRVQAMVNARLQFHTMLSASQLKALAARRPPRKPHP